VSDRDEWRDRQAIYDVMLRYCRGIDRLDPELVASAYHPGAIDHHTGFDGPVEAYVVWVERGLRRLGGTMHMLANHSVELRGDRAVAETYGQAVHWPDDSEEQIDSFTTGFRYIDELAHRDGRWAITERWAVREWQHSNVVATLPTRSTVAGPAGRRDGQDPLYLALARLDQV
jgi:hypothetical protein